jgi:branched-chain amino acid transport system ATP-binding protein
MMNNHILTLNDISFNYGGLKAVFDFSMHIKQGSITSLIGPNGAGKTTVFNLICGVIHPFRGDIVYKNKNINTLSPHAIAALGIGRTFQNIRLFPSLTVREHISLSQYTLYKSSAVGEIFGSPASRRDKIAVSRKTEEIMEKIGLSEYADELAINLSYGLQRRVEFARTLAVGTDLILLDEPTAGMNIGESDEMMGMIQGLTELDMTVLLVEHDMRVVMSISSEIWVMNQGTLIASGTAEEIKRNPLVIEAYLGE